MKWISGGPTWKCQQRIIFFLVGYCLSSEAQVKNNENGYVGSRDCAVCHAEIFGAFLKSGHARSLKKAASLDWLLKRLPIEYPDIAGGVQYRLEKSLKPGFALDLVASKDRQSETLHLLWAFGTERRAITFLGLSDREECAEGRLSWYQDIDGLDITLGSRERVRDAHDALGRWLNAQESTKCFSCHTTRESTGGPKALDEANAGIQCERCHGPGQKHMETFLRGGNPFQDSIKNPARLSAQEQLDLCGECHGAVPKVLQSDVRQQIISDPSTVRSPAKRLVLSRCYQESRGGLTCTICHNPHKSLGESVAYYDQKCLLCHSGTSAGEKRCPSADKVCLACHLQRQGLTAHLDFVDHWIRKIEKSPKRVL
jgi:Cytochrome c554 and c-prime